MIRHRSPWVLRVNPAENQDTSLSGSRTVASLVGRGVQGGDRALQGTHSVGGHGVIRTGDIQQRQPTLAGVRTAADLIVDGVEAGCVQTRAMPFGVEAIIRHPGSWNRSAGPP